IRSPSTNRSPVASSPPAGSSSRAWRISSRLTVTPDAAPHPNPRPASGEREGPAEREGEGPACPRGPSAEAPLWHGRAVAEIAGQDLEAGHAHRYPHLNLRADQAAVDVVGDLAADLDPAVHRARMHDQRVGLGGAQFVVIESEEVKILARRGHKGAVH